MGYLTTHRLTLDLWFAKDNRFLNPKSSYKRILMAPPCPSKDLEPIKSVPLSYKIGSLG